MAGLEFGCLFTTCMRRHLALRMTNGSMANNSQLFFLGNVRRLFSVISEMDNPFQLIYFS